MAVEVQSRAAHAPLGANALTIDHAVDHLVEAATGVVKNQLELARLDLQAMLGRVLRGAALVVVGALLLGGAALAFAAMAYALFPGHVPPEQRLAILGGVSTGGGLAFLAAGAMHLRRQGGRSNGRG
jgi:hypothetical protein